MKISTYSEYKWDAAQDRYVLAYDESYEYAGPVAQCFGGGGGSTIDNTPEGKRLKQAQADMLGAQQQVTLGNYATTAPAYARGLGYLSDMTDDAQSGDLTNRMRVQAGADASMGLGQGMSAASRGLERFGSTMNPNQLASNMYSAGLDGAKMKVDAMNRATLAGEDMKWNRAGGLTNATQGIGVQTANSLGNLASGYGNMVNQGNQAAQAANSQRNSSLGGLGQMGAMIGGYKSGGLVRRFAKGGGVKEMPTLSVGGGGGRIDLSNWNPGGGNGISPLEGIANVGLSAAASHFGKVAAKEGWNKLTQAPVRDAVPSTPVPGAAPVADPLAAGAAPGSELLANVAPGAAEGIADAGLNAGLDGAVTMANLGAGAETAAAGTAATGAGAAAGAAGGGLGSALMASMASNPVGWGLGAAAALYGLFHKHADGGQISDDMRVGGDVNGPGTETSDSIPAQLSDGEYVLNAEAVKLIGKQKLDALNNKGLARREAKGHPVGLSQVKNGKVHASGGFFADLGQVALGAVPVMQAQQRRNDQQTQWEAQQALQQQQLAISQAADTRAQGTYDVQQADIARRKDADDTVANNQTFAAQAMSPDARAGLRQAASNMRATLADPTQSAEDQAAAQTGLSALAQYSPDSIAATSGAAMTRGYGAQVGDQFQSAQLGHLRGALESQAAKFIAAKDYQGLTQFMSDNNNYADGKDYQFNGTNKDGKLLFAQRDQKTGQMVNAAPIDQAALMATVQAQIDPSQAGKLVSELAQQKRFEVQDAHEKARDKIALAQLALSQTEHGNNAKLFDTRLKEANLDLADRQAISDARKTLNTTKEGSPAWTQAKTTLQNYLKQESPWAQLNDGSGGMYNKNDGTAISKEEAMQRGLAKSGNPQISAAQDRARAAIAQGAPRDAVNARLRASGIPEV